MTAAAKRVLKDFEAIDRMMGSSKGHDLLGKLLETPNETRSLSQRFVFDTSAILILIELEAGA